MANNNDDIIEINGKLSLDTNSLDKDITKLIASFKKLEQTGSSKLAKDFQSINAVAKTLDKELDTIMKRFTKNEANLQIGRVNSALKDQVAILKSATTRVEELQDALKSVQPGSARFNELSKMLTMASQKGSSALAGIVEGQQQKSQAQSVLDARRATMFSGAGRAVEMGGMAAQFGLGQWGQQEMRYNQYRAQYNSPGQQMASMMSFDPIAASLFSMQGGNRQINNAKTAADKDVDKVMAKTVFDTVASTLTGFAEGGAGGAVVSGGSTLVKDVTDQGDLHGLSGLGQREANKKAIMGQRVQEAISSGKVNTQYIEDMMKDLNARAPGRQALSGVFGGAGGYGSAMGGLYSGIGKGFSQGEMMERAGALGAAGLSGDQRDIRGNKGAKALLQSFLNTERATGISTQEQIAGGQQFMGNAANPTDPRALRAFSDAVKDGILSGFKQPQIAKTFANAAVELASASKGKLNDMDFYQKQLMGALGGRNLGSVTQRDVTSAMSSIQQANFYAGGGTVRSMATNLYNLSPLAKKLSANDQGMLAQITNPAEVLADKNSSLHQHFLQAVGGDESKLEELMNSTAQNNRSGPLTDLGASLGMDFSDLGNTKNRLSFNERVQAEQAKKAKMDAQGRRTGKPSKYVASDDMKRYQSMSVALQSLRNSQGISTNSAEADSALNAILGQFGDVNKKGELKDQSAHTQERGISSAMAAREAVNDALRGTHSKDENKPGLGDIISQMFTNMKSMGDAMTDPKKGIGVGIEDLTENTAQILALLERTLGKNVSKDDIAKQMLLDKPPPPIIASDGNNGVITPNKNYTNRRADNR